jgi:hypothetical protein
MSVCDICSNSMSTSRYHLPAEIKESNRVNFVHMECCSAQEIKKNLMSYAQNQIKYYQDIIDLIKNTDMNKIRDFEMKYGMYEEVSQGIPIDRETYVAGMISELKKR